MDRKFSDEDLQVIGEYKFHNDEQILFTHIAELRTRLADAESALAGIERTLRYAGDLRRDQSVDLANDLRDIRAALLRQGAAAGDGRIR